MLQFLTASLLGEESEEAEMKEGKSGSALERKYFVRLSTKGQLVVPKEVRLRHGWIEGVELVLKDEGDGVLLRAARSLPETTLEDIVGCAGYRGPMKTLEEMEAAIARGARERR
jgi:AbrB family looped-hinge helix DNA binding protein